MSSKLLVFNNALTLCGERTLASLTENREPRRLLDAAWDGGAVKTCLEANAGWNFGTRTVKIEYDPGVDPEFGFRRAFVKPSDWCRTSVVSASEYLRPPLFDSQFTDEGGYWFSDLDTLYVKFVSDDASYGGDLTIWPESFARYVEAYLASRISFKITRSGQVMKAINEQMEKNFKGATAKDAQDSGTSIPPEGRFNRSRRSQGGAGRRDGGTRGSLVG
ncbi:MAG TPA: hypothetical protein VNA25_00980 [Phycisphaerae bacterium]|nr:hypothetical protein [Phycisphaerae bacterium]